MPARKTEREFTCVVCGKKFIATSNRGAKYCSTTCRNKVYGEKKSKTFAELKRTQREKEIKNRVMAECPEMKESYFKKHEEQIYRQHDPEVWGTAPNDYAEKQRQKTLANMKKIEPVELVPKKEEPKQDKEDTKVSDDKKQVLVYMKGLIAGAMAWFDGEKAPMEIFDKLMKGINSLLDETEVEW